MTIPKRFGHTPDTGLFKGDNDKDLKAQMGEHQHKRHRHRTRPCGNPPAVPTQITFAVQATEAETHLKFTGKARWREVEEDEQGHPTSVGRYDAQLIACDEDGVPVETQDDRARIRVKVKPSPRRHGLKEATNPSGSTFRFETRRNHGLAVGDKIWVKGCKPQTAYNNDASSPYTVLTVPSTTVVTVNGGSSGVADCDKPGVLWESEDNDLKVHVIFEKLPRPKNWYWKFRVRAVDRDQCAGDWSEWTDPILPWTGADPQPPVPTYGLTPITFDNKGKGRVSKVRLKFTFNEVENFDYPGSPADDEDDMSRYEVQLDNSEDGINPEGAPYRHQGKPAKDEDADTTTTVVFMSIRRRYWYRCRVRSVDRFNRRSDWSAWTDWALPFDDERPPAPTNVRIWANANDRVVMDWTSPKIYIATRGTVAGTNGNDTLTGTGTQFEKEVDDGTRIRINNVTYIVQRVTSATSLRLTTVVTGGTFASATLFLIEEDPDVAYYKAQIAKAANVDTGTTPDEWDDIWDEDDIPRKTRASFKVGDNSATYFGRVRSVDAAKNKSRFIPATEAGNSDPDANGEGVGVNTGGGGFVILPFNKPGPLRVKHYPQRIGNPTDKRLFFRSVRASVGTYNEPAGSHASDSDGHPTGAPIKINIHRWLDDDTSHKGIFQDGSGNEDDDRLRIAIGTHKDENWPSDFEIEWLDPDEFLTVRVAQIGSNQPGRDLAIQVWCEP